MSATEGKGVAKLLDVLAELPRRPAQRVQPAWPGQDAAMLHDARTAFAVSTYLAGLGLLAMCVFAGALQRFLARDPRAAGATGAAVTAVAAPTLIVIGMSLSTGLTLGPGSPATEASYYTPLLNEIRAQGPLTGRVEVPDAAAVL